MLYLAQPMLSLNKIIITHFKNYDLSSFALSQNVVGICGLNGKGKTNFLDAIYYCCFTKSYFSSTDSLNVNFDKDGFRLEAYFRKQEQQQKVICINRGFNRKELSLNDVPYDKFSSHIGLLPVVMIAPDDIELITGSSDSRRKFIDTVISQIDPAYLQQLIIYNKILQQRNSLLKRMDEDRGNSMLLQVYDDQLVEPGTMIHKKRKKFLELLIPLVQQFYHMISENAEIISLEHVSQLNDFVFRDLLVQSRQKDLLLQRTNAGIHKDDIAFGLNDQVFKQIASQGQRKSLLFALKLAEFELLKTDKGFAPLLLLDDVFEKLDNRRMQQLLKWVCTENKGQVFITDTHKERLEEAFDSLDVPYQVIEL
ncbi:MAG: DNA replication and repair protein RecF [Ferruginibacter sp.]